MFTSVVVGLDRQYLAPRCKPVQKHAITLRKVLHMQEKLPRRVNRRESGGILGSNLVSHVAMS
jgi:hypothetical protein